MFKKGGYHIFSVPLYEVEKTVERAKIVDGKLEHMLEPEYHGDHLRNKGILVFRNYGLDIKERLLNAGFEHVEIRRILDEKKGITPIKQVVIAKK